MADVSTQSAALTNAKSHRRLTGLLRRTGLRGINPNTPEGQYVADLLRDFAGCAKETVPEPLKEQLAEIMAESVVIRRSMMTFLASGAAAALARKRRPTTPVAAAVDAVAVITGDQPPTPPSVDESEIGDAERKALSIGLAGWKAAADRFLSCAKLLGVEGENGAKGRTLDDLLDELAEQKKTVETTAESLAESPAGETEVAAAPPTAETVPPSHTETPAAALIPR